MGIIFFISLIVKAVLLTLGIFAWKGHEWAFMLFLVVSIIAILVDILAAVVASSADKEIERRSEP